MYHAAEFDLSYSLAFIFAYRWGEKCNGGISLSFVLSSHLRFKGMEKNERCEELTFLAKYAHLCSIVRDSIYIWGVMLTGWHTPLRALKSCSYVAQSFLFVIF